MAGINTVIKLAPAIITMLKLQGIDVDKQFSEAVKFIPEMMVKKKDELQQKHPNLEINLMVSFHEEDVYFIPVGIENNDGKITVSKTFDTINVTKYLQDIKVTKVLKVLKENPELSMVEAVEISHTI